jgi:hypothetical protein
VSKIIDRIGIGTLLSLPSFHPDGRSVYRVTEVSLDKNGTYIHLFPVNPDGHYVSAQGSVATLGHVRSVGWEV